LQLSVLRTPLDEATPTEIPRVFVESAAERPDAVIVNSIGDLFAQPQLIVELVEKCRLPAMYPWRDYAEAGGLMAYAADFADLPPHG